MVARPFQGGAKCCRLETNDSEPAGLDWAWLAGGERPYVFDPPDAGELVLWYAFSVIGVLAVAAGVASVVP